MKIEIIKCLNDNYSYLIFEEGTNTVSIIDPSEFKPCDKVIQKYKKLDYILNTHHHADHVDGNIELKKKYNSKVMGFEDDKGRIPGIDILLKNDQNQKIGNLLSILLKQNPNINSVSNETSEDFSTISKAAS